MNTPARQFSDIEARREQVPLMVGLVGASGSGKTVSALRIATGIQQVAGGDIFGIDTESRRMLHYATRPGEAATPGTFKFRHLQFDAPFGPLDYLAAIEHCVAKGAKTIIVDSLSHEHEGPGGVLEIHEIEMGGNYNKQFGAWAKPKAMRRRLINSMLQLNVNFILCFRAREKLKLMKNAQGKQEPQPRGWQPIAGEEYVYEATLNCLLLPGSNGVPCWNPEHDNEGMIKLPAQFRGIFEKSPQLTEEIGVKLAKWSKGGVAAPVAAVPANRVLIEHVEKLQARWAIWSKSPTAENDDEREMVRTAFIGWIDKTLGQEVATWAEGDWFNQDLWDRLAESGPVYMRNLKAALK